MVHLKRWALLEMWKHDLSELLILRLWNLEAYSGESHLKDSKNSILNDIEATGSRWRNAALQSEMQNMVGFLFV